jgi:thiol-disulfide isomerase/thioredoxin
MRIPLFFKTIIICCFAISTSMAQGIEFFHGTFQEALAKAKAEDKLIFMDAYAEWCGPCKRMAATAFVDVQVGDFFNENFICLKMDMEKGEGPDIGARYPVSAYPTLFFIHPTGEKVHQKVGGLTAGQLLEEARTALGKMDNLGKLTREWEGGKQDAPFLLTYLRALNRTGQPTLKLVNEYLQKNKNATDSLTLRIIFEGATEADSRVFDMLIKNRTPIAALVGEAAVDKRIENACRRTTLKAISFKDANLQKEARAKMQQYLPTRAEAFALQMDMKFFQATKNADEYCKSCEKFVKKEAKTDAVKLHHLAQQMLTAFPENKSALKDATDYVERAIKINGEASSYYLTYASLLSRNGKRKEALTAAEKALIVAKEKQQTQNIPAIEGLIQQLKQS